MTEKTNHPATLSEMSWGFDRRNDYYSSSNTIYSKGTEIYFNACVSDNTITSLIKEFQSVMDNYKKSNETLYKNDGNAPWITLFIDSGGGSVSACFRFVDYVDIIRTEGKIQGLTTVITGCAASAATIMAVVGDERLMTKNAISMIHELWSGSSGQYTHLASYMQILTYLHERIIEIYNEYTGRTIEDLKGLLAKESWYSAKQYLEEGFITAIYNDDTDKKKNKRKRIE